MEMKESFYKWKPCPNCIKEVNQFGQHADCVTSYSFMPYYQCKSEDMLAKQIQKQSKLLEKLITLLEE